MNLLDQVRDVIRKKHYSIRTEEAYVEWIKRFVIFHKKRHPKYMGEHVLGIELGDFGHMERAGRPERLPTVMTKTEVSRILAAMLGTYGLMAKLSFATHLLEAGYDIRTVIARL